MPILILGGPTPGLNPSAIRRAPHWIAPESSPSEHCTVSVWHGLAGEMVIYILPVADLNHRSSRKTVNGPTVATSIPTESPTRDVALFLWERDQKGRLERSLVPYIQRAVIHVLTPPGDVSPLLKFGTVPQGYTLLRNSFSSMSSGSVRVVENSGGHGPRI